MQRPQWITLAVAIVLLTVLYIFGRTVPRKHSATPGSNETAESGLSVDSILANAKRRLSAGQLERLNALEHSVVRGDVRAQTLKVDRQLAEFWADTAHIFEPYAWYEAEAARLENSEKSLTFAAHLFLQNLRAESDPRLREWKAEQSRDLFERSLRINPGNDSSIVGLGACYIFGGIGSPMQGIMKVRAVADKDTTNIFAQEVLGQGSMVSGQYDKAIARFETVYRLASDNPQLQLEASLMLAEAFERQARLPEAIAWYQRSLPLIRDSQIISEVKGRIDQLSSRNPANGK